uniref:Paraneoplastic antigen Ma-like N-terminal domain-containing protein n=1 Tax=Pygocentrus nattereri TaxID=42514 RepID=A0AAR2LNH2_PYGNA
VCFTSLRNWCRGEGLDIKHVFMLIGVPEDTDVAYIEETMQSIKALGRVRVRELNNVFVISVGFSIPVLFLLPEISQS